MDTTAATSQFHYLIELRNRLLRWLWLTVGLFCPLAWYGDSLFAGLAHPWFAQIGQPLVATQITAPLLVPMTIAAYTALILSLPFAFYQLWRFVTPALYPKESWWLLRLTLLSAGLMGLGLVFAYAIVLPLLLHTLTRHLPPMVRLLPDISSYINLAGHLLLAFSMIFQLPLVMWLLHYRRWVSRQQLQNLRPYVTVAIFIIGMLLTPPDVLAQILVAVPCCALYEIGVLSTRLGPPPMDHLQSSRIE